MNPLNMIFTAVGLLLPIATTALELDVDDPGTHPASTLKLY
jgi:hypothetical protein